MKLREIQKTLLFWSAWAIVCLAIVIYGVAHAEDRIMADAYTWHSSDCRASTAPCRRFDQPWRVSYQHDLTNAIAVDLGGGKIGDWPDARLEPLAEYIYSLRAPAAPPAEDAGFVERGKVAFVGAGCPGCHGGPRGGGSRVYTYDEIGTDRALEQWCDPNLDGVPDNGIRFIPGDTLPHGIKSPRLAGEWAMSRFLHNGSAGSLEDVFCLMGARPTVTTPAYGDAGHAMTCEGSEDVRRAMVAYLRAQ